MANNKVISLSLEEMAVSAAAAFGAAIGDGRSWDGLTMDEQDRWVRSVKLLFDAMKEDELPAPDVAYLLKEYWVNDDPALSALVGRQMVAWEAAVRHLAALSDTDEIESAEDLKVLERSWALWARRFQNQNGV